MSSKSKTFLIWAFLLGMLLVFAFSNGENDPQPYASQFEYRSEDQFLKDLEDDEIYALRLDTSTGLLSVYTKTRGYYRTADVRNTLDERLSQKADMIDFGAFVSEDYESQSTRTDSGWTSILIFAGVVFALVYFFLKKAGAAQGNILSLRKSKARVFDDYTKVTFDDVGGCAEAKEELGDVIDFLRNPERWRKAGVRLPRGILLEGPPGCGKTLLARAVAGEASAKFFLASASEFVEMFVGVGAARVRDMFEQAVKEAPAIVFIDELDAVGRRRGSGIGAANDEREQTLNQLLVCLDGFEPNDQVVVLAATNRADILDKALVRPGRFDRRLAIPMPSHEDRIGILKIHCEPIPLSPDVSLDALARKTEGLNGAQIENLVNEAAMLAVRRARYENQDHTEILMRDFDTVLTKKKEAGLLFDQLDSVLIESVTQLAEPTGRAVVRIRLIDGTEMEGEVAWMDAAMVKLKSSSGGDLIVAKNQIAKIEALEGTEQARLDDLKPDTWLSRSPDLA